MPFSYWSLPVRDWKWWWIFAVAIAIVLPGMLPSLAVSIFTGDNAGNIIQTYSQQIEMVKFSLYVIISIVVVSLLSRRVARREDFGLTLGNIPKTIIATVVGLAVFGLVNYLFYRFVPGAVESGKQVGNSLGTGVSLYRDSIVIFTVAVLTPIGEEFFFRGLIFRSFREAMMNTLPWMRQHAIVPVTIAMFISSYIFMMAHGGDGQDLQLLGIALFGTIASYAYAWSGSLYAGVLIHSFNNAYGVYSLAQNWTNPTVSYILLALTPFLTFGIMMLIQHMLPREAQS